MLQINTLRSQAVLLLLSLELLILSLLLTLIEIVIGVVEIASHRCLRLAFGYSSTNRTLFLPFSLWPMVA